MKTGLAARHELVSFNRPLARGAPVIAANENRDDPDFDDARPRFYPPDPHPLYRIRIVRQTVAVTTRQTRALTSAAGRERDHGRALAFAPVCLGAGAAVWFGAAQDPSPVPLTLLFLLLFATALHNRYRRPVLALLAGAMALAVAGALLAAIETWRTGTILLDQPVTTEIVGIVESREAGGAGRFTYDVRLLSTADPILRRMPQRVSLVARGVREPAAIGDRLTGRARLTPPSGPALPQLHDFAFGAFFDGKGANGYFLGPPRITRLADAPDTSMSAQSLTRRLHAARAAIGDHIRATIGGDAGAFAAALITNEQRAISPATTDVLRRSGLAHVIAISGMNMALAAGIFFVGLRSVLSLSVGFVQGFPVKKLAAAGALAATTAYYMISGFAVSAERAYLMMVIMLVAVLFDRPAVSLRNIGLSALLILVMTPSAILGASLQMSYAGTLGLVAGYAYWAERKPKKSKHPLIRIPPALSAIGRFLSGVFVTSLIGGASTALFSAEHFQRISTYGLAANILAEPLISLIVMPCGFLAMLLMPFGLDTLPLLLMGQGLRGVIAVGTLVSGWGGQWQTGMLPSWFFSSSSLGFLLLTLLHTRLRLVGPAMFVAAACLRLVLPAPALPDFVLAEDGRLAAFVTPSSLNPNSARPNAFLFGQWQRALNIGTTSTPEILSIPAGMRTDSRQDRYRPLTDEEEILERVLMQQAADSAIPGRFACKAKSWCIARQTRTGTIAVIENSIYTGTACDIADIVIAAPPRSFDSCRSGALLITRQTLRQTGALTFHFQADPRRPALEGALASDYRPWGQFRHYDWRTGMTANSIPPAIALLLERKRLPPPEDASPGRSAAGIEDGALHLHHARERTTSLIGRSAPAPVQ